MAQSKPQLQGQALGDLFNRDPITNFKKDKVFAPNVDKTGKKPAKKAFTLNAAPIKISSKTKAKEIKRDEPLHTQDRYKSTLRELE
ncbi:hypothetical protein ACFX2I_028486 [Malus domestica]